MWQDGEWGGEQKGGRGNMGVVGKVCVWKWKYSQGRRCGEKLVMRRKMEAGGMFEGKSVVGCRRSERSQGTEERVFCSRECKGMYLY